MPAARQSMLRRAAGYLPYLAGAMALAAVVLGVFGFRALPSPDGVMRWDEALYRSLGLFVLEYHVSPAVDLPLPLNIARFLAPALTGYALVQAALALLSEFHARRRRKRFQGHRIVCGLGRRGRFVTLKAAEAGSKVVALDPSPDSETAGVCEQQGISLIRGDGADSAALMEAGITRASEIYIFTRDDNVNLEIAHAIRRTRATAGRSHGLSPLQCYLSVGELRLASLIPAHQRFLDPPANMNVHAFNSHQNAARDLWERMIRLATGKRQCFPLAMDDPRTAHVFLIGSGDTARAIFGQIARLAHFGNLHRTCVTVTDPAGGKDFSGLDAVLEVRTICGSISSEETTEAWTKAASSADVLVSIIVCAGSEAAGLRVALDINDRVRLSRLDIPIFVHTAEVPGIHEFLADEMESHDLLRNVHGFGALADTCSLEAILRPRTTALAKAMAESFLAEAGAGERGYAPTDPNASQEWDGLPEYLKETNRAAAEHIRVKCLALGCDSDAGKVPTEAEIRQHLETLAEVEHRRWMAEKLLAGWRPGESTDPLHQTHQNLVPWDHLADAEKEKDRRQVLAIPRMLKDLNHAV
jgi:hypothetical protein